MRNPKLPCERGAQAACLSTLTARVAGTPCPAVSRRRVRVWAVVGVGTFARRPGGGGGLSAVDGWSATGFLFVVVCKSSCHRGCKSKVEQPVSGLSGDSLACM